MKRICIKIIMFISSYFPLYIMLLLLHYSKFNDLNKLLKPKIILFLSALFVCIMISVVSIFLLFNAKGTAPLKIGKTQRPDDTIISYMMTYIIPILSIDFSDNGIVMVNVILFLLIGYLYVRLNLLYLNPLWSLFGYLPFIINDDTIVISNMNYIEIKNREILRGTYIANGIFVAQKRINKDM